MDEQLSRLGRREQQIVDLLLQGCENSEIASVLNIAERTVKAHFNRLFVQFGIRDGIKRVKLATLLYRRQLCTEQPKPIEKPAADPVLAKPSSSSRLPKAVRTGKLQMPSVPPSTSSRTISV